MPTEINNAANVVQARLPEAAATVQPSNLLVGTSLEGLKLASSRFQKIGSAIAHAFASARTEIVSEFSKLKPSNFKAVREGAYYERKDVPVESSKLREIRDNASLASFAYTRDDKALATTSGKWELGKDLAKTIANKDAIVNRSTSTVIFGSASDHIKAVNIDSNGGIVDKNSGLTCYFAINADTKEIKVIFGGTTSGGSASDDMNVRTFKNFGNFAKQWAANIKETFGGVPQSYQQAARIVQALQQQVKSDASPYSGFTISTVGHSKGAGEAVFAALAQKEPVHAHGFSSAHMGRPILKHLPAENVARAKELVEHLHVKNDPVPNTRYLIPMVQAVGVEMVIPANGLALNPIMRHDQFLSHIDNYVGQAAFGKHTIKA